MSERLSVQQPAELLAFLQTSLPQWSRNTIKQRLSQGCVMVNGQSIRRHNHALVAGDQVELLPARENPQVLANRVQTQSLTVLYKDADLVAIAKPAGLLSVNNEQDQQDNALNMLRRQLSRRDKPVSLWPAHRLDRETSGVLLLTFSRAMQEAVMANWDKAEKVYLAIVQGKPNPAAGTINQPLRRDPKIFQMHVGAHPEAKPAITHYQTLKQGARRALVEVRLQTGRQHQIRAHMAWLGNPVVGDPRYGRAGARLGLHALRLSLPHPRTGKPLTFTTDAGEDFYRLLEGS